LRFVVAQVIADLLVANLGHQALFAHRLFTNSKILAATSAFTLSNSEVTIRVTAVVIPAVARLYSCKFSELRRSIDMGKTKMRLIAVLIIVLAHVCSCYAQPDDAVPISTQWLLDGTTVAQRDAIRSVLMIVCDKTSRKGTGFLVVGGIVVTDEHVVRGCSVSDLYALSSMGSRIKFLRMVTDADRDLALLRPLEKLTGGLTLAVENPSVGAGVTTWGFPLIYNGPSPLLSVGYVAGYRAVPSQNNKPIKHVIVNGAFNPGNSGGPLLLGNSNKVIGVVVWKMRFLAPWTDSVIEIVTKDEGGAKMCCAATETLSDGTTRGLSATELTGRVLREFYNSVQVVIGEATSAIELKKFIDEKGHELE
jgi:S1-C subfamily serine protease